MLKRVLRRVVYFGIPVAMWLAGAACVDAPNVPQAPQTTTYRCSRVGCGKTVVAAVNASPPACSCGSPMVLDQSEGETLRLQK